jgi:uncharacterized protein (DUF849 family)
MSCARWQVSKDFRAGTAPIPIDEDQALKKIILSCALTGGHEIGANYPEHLSYPVTPEQIARDAIAVAQRGAAIVHIHARDPVTRKQTRDITIYQEICDRIRASSTDVLINLTCGHAAFFLPDPDDESRAAPGTDVGTVAERIAHIEACLPDICSLDVTTANQVDGGIDFVYLNTPRTLRAMATRFQQLGVKPEMEVFQAGDIMLANQLVKEGILDAPPLFQFVLGVKWGAPATPETMIYMRDLLPDGATWAGFGIAALQMPMVAQAALLGGNVRVGLEDNLYLRKGEFATNVQLVERAARLIEGMGYELATPAEARAMLRLKDR